jgi:hypothetical protein
MYLTIPSENEYENANKHKHAPKVIRIKKEGENIPVVFCSNPPKWTYIHAHMHIYIYMNVYVSIYVYTHICINIDICMFIYINFQLNIY